MSLPLSSLQVMTNMKFPKSPAQAYREVTADVVSYNVGLALRVIWEVAKPIMKWTVIISLLTLVGILYFFWQVLFGTMKK